MNPLESKLPSVGTTIFTVMSALAAQYKAINLAQGFPDFEADPHLMDLVREAMRAGHNQYAPMPGLPALRQQIAARYAAKYDREVDADSMVTVTAGGTQALFCAISALVRPGDEAIIIEPAYDSYKPVIELNGGIAVPYALRAETDFRVDWQAFAQLITARTRLIMINTPHNPTGKVLDQADFLALQELVRGREIYLISDEVYEHLIFDGRRHWSLLDFPELAQRGFAIYSFGKNFHVTGWKTGYAIAPPELTREFRKIHQFNVFSVSTPVQHALSVYMSDLKQFDILPEFFRQKRDFFAQRLEGSRFRLIPCEGTYFQMLDYAAISEEGDAAFTQRITKEHGVALIPVSAFYTHPPRERVVRACFAKREATLEAAADILCRI